MKLLNLLAFAVIVLYVCYGMVTRTDWTDKRVGRLAWSGKE